MSNQSSDHSTEPVLFKVIPLRIGTGQKPSLCMTCAYSKLTAFLHMAIRFTKTVKAVGTPVALDSDRAYQATPA